MQDTWAARDLPVLEATVSLHEQSYMVTVTDIAARSGLEVGVVARALEALDPIYVDFRKTTTGGDPRYWYVFKVTPEARRAVGQWPTADSLVSKLAEELAVAARAEVDAERRGLLVYAARLIGDTLRDVAVRAASQVLAPAFADIDWPEEEPLPIAPLEAAASAGPPVDATPPEVAASAAAPAETASREDAPAEVASPDPAELQLHVPRSPMPGLAPLPDMMTVLERTARGLMRLPDTLPAPETTAPDLVPLADPATFPETGSGPETRPSGAATSDDPDAADADHNLAQARADT